MGAAWSSVQLTDRSVVSVARLWWGNPVVSPLGSAVSPPSWVHFPVLPEHRDASCVGCFLLLPPPLCRLWSPVSQDEVWGEGDTLSHLSPPALGFLLLAHKEFGSRESSCFV